MPSSPQPSSLEHRPVFVSGIRYDEFPFPDEDSEQVAKEHLRQQIHDVNLDQVGERLVYGNSAGLTLLGELEELKESMTLLQKRVAESETTIEGHRKEIAELQTRVGYLTASSEGYLAIRRRFLDVYKRDIKSMEELRNPRAIRNGNVVAHEGDALSDAVVFDRDRRSDRSTFRELYGLEYGQVLEFCEYCG